MHLPGLDRFLAVVEAGSLNKAAEQLHISQPALTKSIQVLEERLGVELFVRQARGVSLTTYGKAVLLRARLVDAEMRKIGEDIEALQQLAAGSVNVGAPPGAGFHTNILPAVTLRLVGGERKLSVNYSMGTREQLLPALRQGGLDFVIGVVVEDETTADLVQEPLFEDRNCMVVRAGHPLLRDAAVDIEQVLAYPWIVMTETVALERALRNQARLRGLAPGRSIVHSDSSQLLKSAVLASDVLGLTRFDVSRADIRNGVLCEVPLAHDLQALGRHTMGLIYRRDAELSAASRQLMAEIKVECGRQG
ncbi:MAG TPA: LysR substrate-binding domain-containing protein [Ramlibacter sp.]|nr:LysR substrate-binding domain-containing protein [Ramlibacter sp.]